MKRFVVFIASFIVVFFLLQWGSGFLLTALHTPDAGESTFLQTVQFGENSVSLILLLLSVAIAYVVSRVIKSV
ncbi:hypothetical protein [Alkalihalobacillus sp. CinArs1]|uniref:hypothetical protein n=1 Tax=Alkalihalobacillus sp. CinArs1 TaxID=2995314 RepID=UPI0022DD41AB|nr:hypothetical protein [Alkalihalobacillus sp. CinArs1]